MKENYYLMNDDKIIIQIKALSMDDACEQFSKMGFKGDVLTEKDYQEELLFNQFEANGWI